MSKYTLICDHGDGNKVIHKFCDDFLPDVLKQITYFLRGASFVINQYDNLKLVSEEVKFKKEKKHGKSKV